MTHDKELIKPTSTPAMIPCRVVPFQNKSIKSAGKFAEAAIAKAQPTKNVTFMPSKASPSTIAKAPIPTEAIFATRTV